MKQLFYCAAWLMLCACFSIPVNAQVSGYGISTGVTTTNPNWSSGIHYMDDNRAATGAPVSAGPSSDKLTFAAGSLSGSFTKGDMVLFYHSKTSGAGTGVHQNAVVDSVITTAGVQTGLIVTPIVGSHLVYISGTPQVIRINQYNTFTISGSAVVTCHPFDYTTQTGGVLCMIVKGTLTVNGGIFTVNGCGFETVAEGGAYGAGGSGGAGTASNGLGAGPWNSACMNISGTNTPITLPGGTNGGTVTSANDGGVRAPNSNIGSNYGPSRFYDTLKMGSPGYYKIATPTYGGGAGAQGGAGGGNGGSSACPNPGSAGTNGGVGGKGGDPGKGGRGGGAMVIKANTVQINVATPVFYGNGGDAFSGWAGGNGGQGGDGGLGGDGCSTPGCVSSTPPGAVGGPGQWGAPAGGGDAGNGGNPGTIWIAAKTAYNTTAASKANNYSIKGGKGGKGGEGGMSPTVGAVTLNVENKCTGLYCSGASGGCPTNFCDINKIMCQMPNATATPSYSISGTLINFMGAAPVVTYDTLAGVIYTSQTAPYVTPCGNVNATFVANLFPIDDCTEMMRELAGILSVSGATLKPSAATFSNPSVCNSLPAVASFDISFSTATGGSTYIKYFYDYATNHSYLQNMVSGKMCYISSCYPVQGVSGGGMGGRSAAGIQMGPPGRAGDDAPDGTFDSTASNPTDNIVLQTGGTWAPPFSTGVDDATSNSTKPKFGYAIVYPNPVSKDLWIEFESSNISETYIFVYDLTGKQVMEKAVIPAIGLNKTQLNVSELRKGTYLVRLAGRDAASTFTIIVE